MYFHESLVFSCSWPPKCSVKTKYILKYILNIIYILYFHITTVIFSNSITVLLCPPVNPNQIVFPYLYCGSLNTAVEPYEEIKSVQTTFRSSCLCQRGRSSTGVTTQALRENEPHSSAHQVHRSS